MAKRYHKSAMISEAKGAPCHLPTQVIDKVWPAAAGSSLPGEPDLFMGVQKQINQDSSDLRKAFRPSK
jgi:hypothetical protein